MAGDRVEDDDADEEQARTEQVHHHVSNARDQRAAMLAHHHQTGGRQRVDLDEHERGEQVVGVDQRDQREHGQIGQDAIDIILGRLNILLRAAHAAQKGEENDQQEHRQRHRFQHADADFVAPRRGEVAHLVGVAVARLQRVDHHAHGERQIRRHQEQRRMPRAPAAHHRAGDRAHQRQQDAEERKVLNELHVRPPPFPKAR